MEDVGHAVWSFSIPKLLRPYFLFHRELLTELARAGYETVYDVAPDGLHLLMIDRVAPSPMTELRIVPIMKERFVSRAGS